MKDGVRIERTFDAELVRKILTHPQIYPHVSDDGSPPPEEFDPRESVRNDAMYFLVPMAAERPAGLYVIYPHNSIMYEVHACILPEYRGAAAREAARAMVQWVFAHTPCRKLIALVPAFNRLAHQYARRVGFMDVGVITRSYLKAGVLYDQHLLAIEKER
ncbi:MAG: GNAT family N-acetyltransferase [Pseudomonadota bacterium]